MKEPVRHTKHPWIVGIAVAAIAVAYFVLLSRNDFPEPGANIEYDVEQYAALDRVPTRFSEVDGIDPDFENLRALSITPDGMYVAGEDVIAVFDNKDTETARFTIDGTPNCLAVAPDGALFVGMPTRVQVLNADGTVQASWDDFSERSYLTSIAVNGDDVYIADAGTRVVYRYTRDGERLETIGAKNDDRDIPGIEVPSPYLDLAVNDEGHLWVVNPGKLGMERYRENGEIVTSWYRPDLRLEGFSGCCNPTHVAFSQDGRLITAEKGLVRIKVYDVTDGEYQELVAGSSLFPREQSLRDIAVDARDRVLVIDPRTDSIRIFELEETRDETASQPA